MIDKTTKQASKKPQSAATIGSMFDEIATGYDKVNRLLSFGLDLYWRRALARLIPKDKPVRLLDLATGTADQLISLTKRKKNLVSALGIDISQEMIHQGQKKLIALDLTHKISLCKADALDIPLEAESVECVTMSFGLRNVVDLQKCVDEAFRVLTKGGRVIILEFSRPENRLVRAGHKWYLKHLVPFVGGLVTKKRYAYHYLQETIDAFVTPSYIVKALEKAGFKGAYCKPLSRGIVSVYVGDKP